jgi:NAD+ kinase
VRALLEEQDRSVERMLASHEDHVHTQHLARTLLDRMGVDATFRYRADAHTAEHFDLVITLGGDGTLLWASHLVGKQPMLAINTAPKDSVGFFCAGSQQNLEDVLADALAGRLRETQLTRMQIELDGEVVSQRVLNDMLFCHHCPASTTRYIVRVGKLEEEHKSSGIWVGPAAGSTAAQRSAGGKVLPATSERLQYVVREPYTPDGSRYRLTQGLIAAGGTLQLLSKIHGARIYVDGPHLKREVALGSEIVVRRSPENLTLLGFTG